MNGSELLVQRFVDQELSAEDAARGQEESGGDGDEPAATRLVIERHAFTELHDAVVSAGESEGQEPLRIEYG